MKAILEFGRPEEEEDFILATNGKLFALVCWEMESEMRRIDKYENGFKTVDEVIEHLRQHLRYCLRSYNINLEMIP